MKSFFLAIILLIIYNNVYPLSQGFNSPTSVVNDASVGTVAWITTANSYTSDNNYTSAFLLIGQATNYLKATDFGFSIPMTATLTGIEIEVEQRYNPTVLGGVDDLQVRILKGGIIGSNTKECCAWPTSDAYRSYGNSSDAWGETWTPSDINNSNFGIAIAGKERVIGSGTARIDHIRIKVHYTTVLPITLIKFDVSLKEEGETLLEWSTANEINNDYFTIERSNNGIDFLTVGILGGNGNSNTILYYSFIDKKPLNGVSYYRLKQTDFNGMYKYYKTVSIINKSLKSNNEVKIYPNPFADYLVVKLPEDRKKKWIIEFNDVYGKIIYRKRLNTLESNNLDLTFLPKGTYFLNMFNFENRIITKKVIKY